MATTQRNALATVVILAHPDPIELRHTVNSVLQSAAQAASSGSLFETVILDESQLYKKAYHVDNTKLRVIHTLTEAAELHSSFTFLVPQLTLVSADWLASAVKRLKQSGDDAVVRPQLHITWGDGEPVIFEQPSRLSPLYSLYTPAYSGIVGLTHDLFTKAIRQYATDVPASVWLPAGLPWLDHAAGIVAGTAAFTRPVDHSTPVPSMHFWSPTAAKTAAIAPPQAAASLPQVRSISSARTRALVRRSVITALRRSRLLGAAKKLVRYTGAKQPTAPASKLPHWLIDDWRALHRIDNRTFPSNHLLTHLQIGHDLPYETQRIAYLYAEIARSLSRNHYDYILFAPWLTRGGADKFTVNYANTIATLQPDHSVLVITTLPRNSEWAEKLAPAVDYCDFGNITQHTPDTVRLQVLEALLAQLEPRTLHIINSELGYDFVYSHKQWLANHSVQVVATSFSQEMLDSGRVLGYSHTHVPEIYDETTLITSDNRAVVEMWRQDYGFDARKLLVHHLPYTETDADSVPSPATTSPHEGFRVLWASRLSREKMPQLVRDIGIAAKNSSITIDMYGTKSHDFDDSWLHNLPANVHYKGPFNGPGSLPLRDYDAFLYTSLFDGMPNTLLEIGLEGLPIVASAVGGIPELIEPGETGLLVAEVKKPELYANALRQLRDKPEVGRVMAQKLQLKITREHSAKQFEKAVAAMLQKLGYE